VLQSTSTFRLRRTSFQVKSQVLGEPSGQIKGVTCRGYLPHVTREGATYFITFRLADSVPVLTLRKLQQEKLQALSQAAVPKGNNSQEVHLRELEREHRRRMELCLDQSNGACWLKQPEIASLLANTLKFFQGKKYWLKAWVIMPNHVHAVVHPLPGFPLSSILHSWKRFSARRANELLGRPGQPFWQSESFDHLIRNEEEHSRCCKYVVLNPVKAGLCQYPEQWRWSSAWVEEPS